MPLSHINRIKEQVCQENAIITDQLDFRASLSRKCHYHRIYMGLKVRKTASVRNRYNQVPHLSKDTKLENNKILINITNKSHKVSPFPSGDHKAAINRCARRHDKHKTYITQTINKRSTALERSVKYFTGGIKPDPWCANLSLSSDMDQDTQMFGLHERPPNLFIHHLQIRTQQYIKLNNRAKEIQQVNPCGPDNSQRIRTLPSHQ